ncbi:MAG: winged helix-turn-helix transcriptional regulator [Candidatus Lokiarchaeia archaeon]
MAMIAQGKPKLKSISQREYRPKRAGKEKNLVNKIIEKFQKFIPLINDTQIFENYKKILNQLITFDSVSGKQFLNHIQENFKKSELDELQLDGDSFLKIFKDILESFTIRLNSSDIKILETIHLNPLISLEGICSTTNLSWGTVQKRYNQLVRGKVYEVVAVPNYEKLELVPMIVITMDNAREIHSKYLTSFQKNNEWNNTTRLWEMLLPKSKIKEGEKIIVRHIQNPQIFEKTFVTNSINFYYYDSINRSWNINWPHWELQLEKQEKISPLIKENESTHQKRKIKKIDLKILSHLTENLRREQRDIAKTLNTSESKVSLCKKNLHCKKYFTSIVQLTERAGLTENLLIILKENFQEIPAALLKLPQITIHELNDNNKKTKQTIIQTKLPPGSKSRIKKVLKRKYQNVQFSNYIIQTKSFPESITEMFDEKNQKWMWNPLTLKIYEKFIKTPEHRNYIGHLQKIEA